MDGYAKPPPRRSAVTVCATDRGSIAVDGHNEHNALKTRGYEAGHNGRCCYTLRITEVSPSRAPSRIGRMYSSIIAASSGTGIFCSFIAS